MIFLTLRRQGTQRERVPAVLGKLTSPDAFTFGGHRYQLVAKRKSGAEANAAATANGGHLATINSAAEQAFLIDTFGPSLPQGEGTWVGGFKTAGGAKWQWVTDEAVLPLVWLRNQPDGNIFPATMRLAHLEAVGLDDIAQTKNGGAIYCMSFIVEWTTMGKPRRNSRLE